MNEVDVLLLKHAGVKGMKWGVRRDSKTGVRPIAKTLDESKFGRKANANAQKHMQKVEGGRKQKRIQKQIGKQQGSIDRFRRVASGHGTTRDKVAVGLLITGLELGKGRGLQGAATIRLNKLQKNQDKIKAGKNKINAGLAFYSGVHVRELNFSVPKS